MPSGARRAGSIALLIFDCDGVLVDTERISNRIFAEAITKAGLPTTFEDSMTRYRGRSTQSAIALIEAALGHALPTGWLEDVNAQLSAAFDKGVRAIDGVEDVIRGAQDKGLKLCVASSSGLPRIRKTLSSAGLLNYFEPHVFSASMVSRGKPAPDLFLYAATVLNEQPDACLVIEDSVPGLLAAQAAGMRVLGYAGGSEADARALAQHGGDVITDMRQALTFLSETY